MTNNHFEPGTYTNTSTWRISPFRDLSLNTTTGKRYGDIGYQTNSSKIQQFGSMLEGLNASTQEYEDLAPLECTKAYDTDFLHNRRNLFLITKDSSHANYSILDMMRISNNLIFPNSWMCPGNDYPIIWTAPRCNTHLPATNLTKGLPWRVRLTSNSSGEVEIAGCKSEITSEKCTVRFSLGIMIVVIGCNLVKACCMVMAVVRSREPTLVTLGDAVDSFLRTPDQTTIGICYADRQYIERDWRHGWRAGPRQWKKKGVQRWWTSASKGRWLTCNFFFCATLISAGGLLRNGLLHNSDYGGGGTDLKSM